MGITERTASASFQSVTKSSTDTPIIKKADEIIGVSIPLLGQASETPELDTGHVSVFSTEDLRSFSAYKNMHRYTSQKK